MIRSRQKQHRQDAILDAAEDLVRELHSTSFSMLSLSEKAGLSPATPYNLFGSKASILYALLSRSLDGIFEGVQLFDREPDPFLKMIVAAEAVGNFFSGDPDYYRPLYQYLLGVTDPVHRPAYMDRALDFWLAALQGFSKAGLLCEPDRQVLARTIVIHIVGVLDLWIHEDIDDAELRVHLLHGVIVLLFHIADDNAAVMLQGKLREIAPQMPSGLSFNRKPQRTDEPGDL